MARRTLVRHGRPVVDLDHPPAQWVLSDEGRARTAVLAEKLRLFAPTVVVASTEPKALGTAEVLAAAFGLSTTVDAGLVEHRREGLPLRDAAQQQALVAEMFDAPSRLVFGEETADEAHARFAEAVERAPSHGVPLLVCHGTVMALWLSRRFGVEPAPLWRSLSTPCAAVLSVDGLSFDLVA